MEKRNRNAGHRYSVKDRALAWLMVFIVTLTMIPYDSLTARAASTTSVKSIGSIQTEYEVDNGTSKDEIGLPDELSVVLETVTAIEGATNGEAETSEDTVDKSVSWKGNYDGDTAGTYALTAEFDDSSLYYNDMPTVYVTVREPETPEPEPTPEVTNSEDEGDGDDEDPDQPKQTEEQNEEQPEEQPEEEPTEEPTEQPEEQPEEQAEPEVVIEEEVEQTEQKDAKGDENFNSPLEAAHYYYGQGGSGGVAETVTVSLTDNRNTGMAGENFTYFIQIQTSAAAEYKYDGQNSERMFEDWENFTLTLQLPENVEIVDTSAIFDSYSLTDPATNTWTLVFKTDHRSALNGDSFTPEVTAHIMNNGVLPDNTVLGPATVTFHAEFDVYVDTDRTQTEHFWRDVTSSTDPITLTTPDVWALTKSPYEEPNNYTIDETEGTVTVHYLIKYGLASTSGIPIDDDNVYKRPGRVPFAENEGPKLTDTPTLTVHNGNLNPESVIVTPVDSGYKYQNGDPADDTSGNPLPIDYSDGVELPYAVVGANNNGVDEDTPAYSQYKVDLVYNYDDFMIWYYENIENTDALSTNIAEIECTLAGQENPQKPNDDGETTIPAYIPPAQITIRKFIVNYGDAQKKAYNSEVKAPVTGAATYQVFEEDGTTPATIYYLDEQNKYQPISGNTLTIDPAAAASTTNGTDGTIGFYLDAGTYVIKETGAPAYTVVTPASDETKTVVGTKEQNTNADFNNKEQLGQIKISKVDDSNNHMPVQGALFGLYYDEDLSNPVLKPDGSAFEKTTNSSGEALFDRLVPGTYWLKEIDVPDAYIIEQEKYGPIEVVANETGESTVQSIQNHLNGTTITLEKYYSPVTNPNITDLSTYNLVTTDYNAFKNKFTLQKSVDGGTTWTDIGTYSIDNQGRSIITGTNITEYEDDVKVKYRFVETVPSGYFNLQGTTDSVTSDVITPADGERLIKMYNLQGGKIVLNKKKIGLNTTTATYSASNFSGKTFELYYVEEGETEAHLVTSKTTGTDGKATFTGLPAASNGKVRTYYVVETNPEVKFPWEPDSTITVNGTEKDALLIGSFGTEATIERTINNTTTAVPFYVVKRDKFTDSRLAGATIKIYEPVEGERTVTTVANKDLLTWARVGSTITFTETAVPSGYYLDDAVQTLDTTGWKVKPSGNTYKIYKADGTEATDADRTITFKDTPYPSISVQKKVKNEGQTDDQAWDYYDAVFKLYKKNEDGTFSPYKKGNNDVTIRADGSSSVSVEDGVYYLHEEISGAGNVVNPDTSPSLYSGGEVGPDDKYYFGPYTVSKPTSATEVSIMLPGTGEYIININNKADLKVNKNLFDEFGQRVDPTAENGFPMYLYQVKADGTEVQIGDPITTGTKPAHSEKVNGQVIFEDLPIYDENGEKYYYYVKEVMSPAQLALFDYAHTTPGDIAGQTGQVQLTGGEVANAGIITNRKKTSVQVIKKYKDMREYELTGTVYNLAGAEIALYRNNGDGTYTYMDLITKTNAAGQALFADLPYTEDGYLGVEVSIPDKPEYDYMYPSTGTLLGNPPPETLTEADLALYNCVKLTKDTTPKYTGTLMNQINWTQIHITKWGKHKSSPDSAYVKLDGTTFILYKQVLPEGTPTDAELSFDANNCTVVNHYTSGTFLNSAGEAQTGELQTDVLDNADSIVYWLVEVTPSPGYTPGTYDRDGDGVGEYDDVILFHRAGTSYTNNSTSLFGNPCNVSQVLNDNQINYDDVHDITGDDPGPGTINIAYIEFSKWRELPNGDFALMPNATFELWAVTSSGDRVKLLDTITTGDENTMGGTTTGYGVSIAIDAWALYDELAAQYSEAELAEIMWFTATTPIQGHEDSEPYYEDGSGRHARPGTFYLNATLIEVAGTSVYELDTHYHNLLITFPTGEFELGNNKYMVTDISQYEHCDETDRINDYDNYQKVAIVDKLAKNHAVTIRHFGYDPEVVGYDMLHGELETAREQNGANFDDVEVRFAIMRYDEHSDTWQNWHYNPGPDEEQSASLNRETFVTSGNGYSFPDGLIAGTYRIQRVDDVEGYENFYDNTPFYFTVTASSQVQVFTTYSPEKPDLTIEKVNFSGEPLDTATFTLDSVQGRTYSDEQSTVDGKVVFKDLHADTTFTLAETVAPDGYTDIYFKELFQQQYPDYADLVTNTGYMIAYETETKDNENGDKDPKDNHVIQETVVKDQDYLTDFTLSAKNAKLVKLEITKVDAQATSEKLEGAVFAVYFKPFDKVSGNYTVPAYPGSGWVMLGDQYTTTDDGTVLIEDLKPGVYYVKETTPPGGYDLNEEGQTIVMTGGMALTIAEGDYTICTTEGGKGELTFENMPKTGLKVYKNVEFGDFPARSYSFTFELKDSEGTTIAGDPAKATGTAEDGVITSTTYAEFKELSQGEDYYLKESNVGGYKLTSVKIGDTEITPEASGTFKGYYKITMPEDGTGVSVTFTNTYMMAQVTIFKYDGETAEALSGAVFEVRTDKDDPDSVYPKTQITDNDDGTYTILIPITDEAGQTFYIHEVQAPTSDDYVIDVLNCDIEVADLKPGDVREYTFNGIAATDNQYVLPNYIGAHIDVTKYGGLPDNSSTATLEGAKLQMYFSTDGGTTWNSWHEEETTDENGSASFLILEGYMYAIAETSDVEGYIGLYNVYSNGVKLDTVDWDGNTLFILGSDFESGETFAYTAYNLPYLKLIVNKEDLSGDVSNPNVDFHVYEVPEGTTAPLTQEEIRALIDLNESQGLDLLSHYTTNSTYENTKFIQPGKTYLAVEDKAKDPDSSEDDYSIIHDDTRVVSYDVFEVPLVNYESEYTVTFKNTKGIPTIGLEKDVDKDNVESLVSQEAELEYTLAPESTNNIALDSYRLKDTGLHVDPSNATLADEWYNITEVIVGQGSMDTFLVGADPDKTYAINATVTFVDFNGQEYPQEPVNVSAGNISVLNTTGENIKSFFIDYESETLSTDTGYALGQNFEANETIAKVTVFKQEAESGSITAIKKITNDADVQLYYSPWSSTGVKQPSTHIEAEDDAVTTVDAVPAPRIQFDKTGPNGSVEIGNSITYVLTITNVSREEVDLTDPIIVDLLPQGMTVNTNTDYIEIDSKPDTISDTFTSSVGTAGASQFVNIGFTGTLAKDEAIVVKLTAQTTSAVTNYGDTMVNYAFTTSKEVGVATADNQAGAVIQDPEGAWAVALIEAADAIGVDDDRAEALVNALGTLGTHGYLADYWANPWSTENEIIGVKEEYGPLDDELYSTTRVSVLINDETDDDQRTMHYQLTVNNTSVLKRTNLAVMDILPVVGDSRLNNSERGSEWQLYYDDIVSVRVNGSATDKYTIYYYTGDASQFTRTTIQNAINAAKESCPDGWTETYPGSGVATAFIVAFAYDPTDVTAVSDDNTIVLEPGKNLQIEYTAITPYREAEELNPIVFTNAANDFNYGFKTFAASSTADQATGDVVLDSNVVEVTITPPNVKVGGDVWIDKNDDGVQNDGDQSWYLEFDIVKQLIQDLSVSLTTSNQKNQTPTGTTAGTIDETGNDPDNYGIAHFEFDELTAAKLRDGGTDWVNWTASQLVGKNPFTYYMDIEYSGSTFTKTINTIDPRGSYPPGSIPEADQKDDNFETATGTTGAYRSEWFFLHQTSDVFDMTKDIGWNIKRELTLTKTSKTTGEPIEGAEFTVYGPFEHDDENYLDKLTDTYKVDTYTTNGSGQIVVPELQFFDKYVIVETKPGTGFSIDGAVGTGVNLSEIETGKWLLDVPDTKQTTVSETSQVQDPELIDVAVEKVWNDNNDEYGDRPTSIKVDLYTNEACTTKAVDINGDEAETKTLNEQNNWKATWTNLPRYDGSDVITYYVKETDAQGSPLVGYNAQIVPNVDETTGDVSFTITNTPIYVGLEVTKEFESDAENPSQYVKSITFKVQRSTDGTNWTDVAGKTLVVTRAADGTYPVASVSGLPKADANGNEYTYRAVEVSMVLEKDGQEETITFDETSSTIGGYTVDPGTPEDGENIFKQTVINTLDAGKLQVKKVWDDNDNQDGKRPVSILIHITADTTYYHFSQDVTLNENNSWTSPEYIVPVKDAKGTTIEYHIAEDSVEDYTTTYSAEDVTVVADETTEVTVTNTYEPTPTQKEARKEWDDNDDAYLTRPDSIEFTLYATWTDDEGTDHKYVITEDLDGNALTNPATVTEDDNWATKWENLPEYQPGEQGKEITYTVEETAVTGHTTTYSYDGDLTIVYNTPIPTSLEVSKEFVGEGQVQGEGKYGQYIKSVTFKVQRSTDGSTWEDVKKNDAVVTLTVTRNEDGTCTTDSVSDLPKYASDGTEYQYKAVEVSMTLVKDGAEETVTFDESGNVIGGYDVTEGDVEEEDEGGYTQKFTNTLNPGTLQVEKVWDDNDNQDGKRPDSIKITVSAETKYFKYNKVLTLNESNNWKSEVLTVPVCDEGGNKITYNIKETSVPNYTTTYAASENVTVSADELTTVTVTNKYVPTPTWVEAIKDWDDGNDPYETRPSSIEFTLYAKWTDDQGAEQEYIIKKDYDNNDLTNPVTVTKDENWQTKWENLPEYQPGQQGKKLTYTVKETQINGFVTTYNEESGVWTIKNTPNTKQLHVKKTWSDEILGVGNYVKSVTFTVQKSIKGEDSWTDVKKDGQVLTVTIERDGNTFVEKDVTGLPECDSEGNYLEYRAVETSMIIEKDGTEVEVQIENGVIGGYNVTEDHEAENLSDIKNSLILGKLKVVKVWDDDDDRDGYRPEKLEVKITAKTDYFEYEKTITLTEDNHWGNDLDPIVLPVMDEAGNKITYTIVEESVEHYTEIVPTYVITAEGVDTVDGTGVTSSTELTEDVVTNDEYTNHHKPEVTNAIGKKIWNDEEDAYGERPKTITFQLWRRYAAGQNLPAFTEEVVTEDEDGNPITELEVTEGADGTWTVEWTNLPVYKKGLKGVKITYYVKEIAINGKSVSEFYGYIIDENGMIVTNTPKETSLKVEKTWAEDLPCIANTVSAVTFQVEKSIDGNSWENVKYLGNDLTVTITRSNGGTFGQAEILGLPAYDKNSNPYTYRATEISITVNGTEVPVSGSQVGGYAVDETHTPGEDESEENATAQDLSQITNTLIRGDLAVEKEWTDDDDNNGARSTQLSITLKAEANGVAITGIPTSTLLSATNDWKDYTTWKNVPVYDAAGNEINYTFTEPTTGDYRAYVTVTSEEEGNEGTTAINPDSVTKIKFRNELILTEFDVVKEFGEDPTGIINSKVKSIKVRIQRSVDDGQTWGEVIRRDGTNIVDLTEDNGWRYRWDDLPRYDSNGTLIQYRAIEVSITTVDGNTYNVVYGSDETEGVVTAYNYTSITTPAGEEPPAHTTLINTIIIGKLKAIKHWDDDNDRDNLRPQDITFHLWQNGVKLGTDWDRFLDGQKAVSENDDENFVLWEQLPVFDIDGKEIEYAYSETMGSSGSGDSGDSGSEGGEGGESGSGSEGEENVFTKAAKLITNTVNKLRGDIEDTNEPTEGGENEGGENEGGEPTGDTYEVIEESNGDYTAEIDLTPATLIEDETVTTTITNKHVPLTTQMYVKKVWVGNFIYGDRPDSVDVYLYATYLDNDDAEQKELAAPEHEETTFDNPATLSDENNWEYTWIDLPVYKTGFVGHKITYSVEEDPVPNGFEVEYAEEEELLETVGSVDVMTTNFTVTNTMKTTNLEVDKTWIDENGWIGNKIKSVTFKVQRSLDGKVTWTDLKNEETGEVVTLTITKQESVATIDELPTFSGNGLEYNYRGVEFYYTLKTGENVYVEYKENTETSGKIGAYNYVSSTEGDNEAGYVTKVENPEINTSLVVIKKWMGDNDNDRPKSLKVTLKTFAGDKEIQLEDIAYTTELNRANGWKDDTTWACVPVYDEYGNKIIYMLEEPAISRYSSSYEITSNGSVLEAGNSTACSTDVFEGVATEVTFKNYKNEERTGDNAPIAAAGGAFAVGLAGLAAVLARKKKRSN